MSSETSAVAPPAKEKRSTDLELSNAKRGVWLVKVPKYIAERWDTSDPNTFVGNLKISKSKLGTDISFSLSDEIVKPRQGSDASEFQFKGTDKQIPKEHKFVVASVPAQTLCVFSHTAAEPNAPTPSQEKLVLEGKVVQRAECKPISNSIYMQLKKDSIIKAIEPTRKPVQLDGPVVAFKPKANHRSNIAFEAKKKAEGKKSRDDKEVVMERLFALFEKHQYYNIKDLVKETRQPVTYLKEVLNEFCHYNLKNPHKNMWELKPEYRHYKQEEKPKEKESSSSDDDE